jgi:hypothetical protein
MQTISTIGCFGLDVTCGICGPAKMETKVNTKRTTFQMPKRVLGSLSKPRGQYVHLFDTLWYNFCHFWCIYVLGEGLDGVRFGLSDYVRCTFKDNYTTMTLKLCSRQCARQNNGRTNERHDDSGNIKGDQRPWRRTPGVAVMQRALFACLMFSICLLLSDEREARAD